MSSQDKEGSADCDGDASSQELSGNGEDVDAQICTNDEKGDFQKSCDQNTELSESCTAVTKDHDDILEKETQNSSGSAEYIDLKNYKPDKFSIEADDSAEKISIQATDSDSSQLSSGNLLSDTCPSKQTISSTLEDENLKSGVKPFVDSCETVDCSNSDHKDIVCGSTKGTMEGKFFPASETCSALDGEDKEDSEDEGDDSAEEGENYESAEEGDANEEELKLLEEKMTPEEKEEKRKEAQAHKEEGNKLFKEGSYKEAVRCYTRALWQCPLSFPKDRAIMYSNRAACKLRMENNDDAIIDCTKAIDLHPVYLKPLLRRAELYEKVEKLEEALVDYQKAVEIDPSQHAARAACLRLPDQIKDRNEKMKAEMMGKLKDLGNMILKPFGLSTNNFELKQDPNSGGYSVNFKQNAPADN